MLEYLQSILQEPWKPVSRAAMVAWLVFYSGFLAYAFAEQGGFLFIDSANLVVHEGGHNLFGWFGPTLGLWGGTLLQWLVPLLLAGELALHGNLHGGRAGAGVAPGRNGRSGLCRARFPRNLFQPGRSRLRHKDCAGCADSGLVWDAGLRRMASLATALHGVRG
jgi:hypothetical protein